MTGPVNNQPFASQRDDSGINDLPGYEDLRAQVLRVRALARSEPESDEDEDLLEDGLDDDLEDNAGYAQGVSRLRKRKRTGEEPNNSFEAQLRQIRRTHHSMLHVAGHEELELGSIIDRLRAQREDDVAEDGGHQDNTDEDDSDEDDSDKDDSDEDEDASAIAQRDTGMNAILNDPRYARIQELFLNPTMDDFEYGRASLMRMVMEPDEEEWGDVALGRVPKKRLSYKITCAIKATNWFERSLEWRNGDFRAFYRVSKSTFWEIVKLVENHKKFQRKGKGRRPRPVHYQVGVFLLRYGCAGSGARVPMLLTSIGEGTVLLYCRRVIAAIRTFGLTCVGWPTPERKRVISAAFQKKCGLNGAVGALDGVHFKLSHKPVVEGDIYMNYKGALSITVQATCDHEGRFTSFQSGLPGSRPDASVWTNSELYKRRNQIFQPGEYLFADGGYPISPFVVIPFNRRERDDDAVRKFRFNAKISSARVVIERTFGQLKGRFPALRLLGPVGEMSNLYRAVEALMVLHNMCYDLHDSASGFVDAFTQSRIANNQEVYDRVDQTCDIGELDVNGGERVFGDNLREAGLFFQDRCMDIICPN